MSWVGRRSQKNVSGGCQAKNIVARAIQTSSNHSSGQEKDQLGLVIVSWGRIFDVEHQQMLSQK